MARIRTVKPEFWTDEKVVTLSPMARLAFIGLWNFCDDEGRAVCSPSRLKMQIFPADPADFRQLLAELSGVGLVQIYVVDGVEYLSLPGFSKHQKIDKRAKSKLPDPPTSAESRRLPPTSAESPQIPPPDQGREWIKEGKNAAPEKPARDEERDLFDRGKQLLGASSGGLIKRLVTAKGGSIQLARAAIETAATKSDPREYLGAIIRGRDSPNDLRAKGDAW